MVDLVHLANILVIERRLGNVFTQETAPATFAEKDLEIPSYWIEARGQRFQWL